MVKFLAAPLAALVFTAAARAQRPATEQVRERTQTLPREDSTVLKSIAEDRGEVVELNGQPARKLRFRTGLSTNLEHQSNAALLPSGPRDDWVSLSGIEAGLNQPLGEKFSFDLSLRTDVAQYFHLENISYWGPSASAIFDYRPRAKWPRFFAGGQLYRYDFIESGRKITDAGAVNAGLDQTWILQGGKSALAAGYQFSRFWASPLTEDRAVQSIFATFTRQLTAKLYAQAAYLWQYTDFENQPRHDSRHTLSAGLIYAPRQSIALRLSANFVRNESSLPVTDYENFSAGLGAALLLQF